MRLSRHEPGSERIARGVAERVLEVNDNCGAELRKNRIYRADGAVGLSDFLACSPGVRGGGLTESATFLSRCDASGAFRQSPHDSRTWRHDLMSKTRVVVTGLGATTPLGGDVASTWQAL